MRTILFISDDIRIFSHFVDEALALLGGTGICVKKANLTITKPGPGDEHIVVRYVGHVEEKIKGYAPRKTDMMVITNNMHGHHVKISRMVNYLRHVKCAKRLTKSDVLKLLAGG